MIAVARRSTRAVRAVSDGARAPPSEERWYYNTSSKVEGTARSICI